MAKNQQHPNAGRPDHGQQGQRQQGQGPDQGRAERLGGASPRQGAVATATTGPREPDRREQPEGQEGGWPSREHVRERFDQARSSAGEMISEYPMVSILTGFGLGFGLGFALATLLVPREEESWSSRSMSDAFWNLSNSLRNLPQVTADYVTSAVHKYR